VAWLGVLGLAATACGGQSRGNERANGGSSVESGVSGVSGSKDHAPPTGGGLSTGGALPAGGTDNAGESAGGSHAGGSNSSVGNAGDSGQAGTADASGGETGIPPIPPVLSDVKPSAGCGKEATQATGMFVKFTIQTSGTKDADCADKLNGIPKCGAWSIPRDYYVWLPPNYDKQRAYPLVIQAAGCSSSATSVYSLSETGDASGIGLGGTVIRVGLAPPPNDIGHPTNPGQGCFDDSEGDDSVEWPFYEALIDKLKTELCYDENRIFAAGSSSGGRLANELGCKYAGNANGYAIRGVAVHGGTLPTQPAYVPSCSDKPMAGIWSDDLNGVTGSNEVAIARAMQVNHCSVGTSYDTAPVTAFPLGQDLFSCKKILDCPAEFPLVVCRLATGHVSNDPLVNLSFAKFLQTLQAP